MNTVREIDFVEIFEKKGFTREETNLIIDYLAKTSATRADLKDLENKLSEKISQLRETMGVNFVNLKNYIDTVKCELEAKIDGVRNEVANVKCELEAKIDTVKCELEAKIDTVKCELEKKIVQESHKQLLWFIGAMTTITGIALTIFGLVTS